MAGMKKKRAPKESRATKIWKLARSSNLLRDGELELDLNAKISESPSNGAYIQTWMWVSFEDTDFDKGEPDGPKDWSPIKKRDASHKQIWQLASNSNMLRDGELELDLNAKISEGDSNGAYIETWMWVDFDGTKLDKEAE